MLPVVWLASAEADLAAIIDYIGELVSVVHARQQFPMGDL